MNWLIINIFKQLACHAQKDLGLKTKILLSVVRQPKRIELKPLFYIPIFRPIIYTYRTELECTQIQYPIIAFQTAQNQALPTVNYAAAGLTHSDGAAAAIGHEPSS